MFEGEYILDTIGQAEKVVGAQNLPVAQIWTTCEIIVMLQSLLKHITMQTLVIFSYPL